MTPTRTEHVDDAQAQRVEEARVQRTRVPLAPSGDAVEALYVALGGDRTRDQCTRLLRSVYQAERGAQLRTLTPSPILPAP